MSIRTNLELDNRQFKRKLDESDRALNRTLGKTGEAIERQTEGLRKFTGALNSTVGIVTEVVGIVGAVAGIVAGIAFTIDRIASASERAAKAAEKERGHREAIRRSVSETDLGLLSTLGADTSFERALEASRATRLDRGAARIDQFRQLTGVGEGDTAVLLQRNRGVVAANAERLLDAGVIDPRRIRETLQRDLIGGLSPFRTGFLGTNATDAEAALRDLTVERVAQSVRDRSIRRRRMETFAGLGRATEEAGGISPLEKRLRDLEAREQSLLSDARSTAADLGMDAGPVVEQIRRTFRRLGEEAREGAAFGRRQRVGSAEVERLRAVGAEGAASRLERRLELARKIREVEQDITLSARERATIIEKINAADEARARRAERERERAERARQTRATTVLAELTASATGDPGGVIGRELKRLALFERIGGLGVDDPDLLRRLFAAGEASLSRTDPTTGSDAAAFGGFSGRSGGGGLSGRVIGPGPQSLSASAASIDSKAGEMVGLLREIAASTRETAEEAARGGNPASVTGNGAGLSLSEAADLQEITLP